LLGIIAVVLGYIAYTVTWTNTAIASTEGLLTMDGTHFDSAGQRELGKRYAEALLSLDGGRN
jgi:lysophospholipase L1-like esterase